MLNWIKEIKSDIKTKDTKIFLLVLTCVLAFFSYRAVVESKPGLHYFLLICSFSVFSISLIRPAILRPLHLLLAGIFKFITTILTSIVLLVIFYIVVTPIGLCLRLWGKDLLDLKFTDQGSYWQKKEDISDNDRYLKQY